MWAGLLRGRTTEGWISESLVYIETNQLDISHFFNKNCPEFVKYLLIFNKTFAAKANIQLETQHPEGMRKIQALEQRAPTRPDEPERAFEKPVFTSLLTGPSELWEGQNAHFECRVVPVGDPNLRFEWFVNGIELKMGMFQTVYLFICLCIYMEKCKF